MFYFVLIILSFIILISTNIFILNEETLILICFITFCWIGVNRFSELVTQALKKDANKIEDSLSNSLDQILISLTLGSGLKEKFQNLLINFNNLGNYIFNVTLVVNNRLPNYIFKKVNVAYPKRFLFTQRLEQQMTKLFILLILHRLNEGVSINQFCLNKLKLKSFSSLSKITSREYMEMV